MMPTEIVLDNQEINHKDHTDITTKNNIDLNLDLNPNNLEVPLDKDLIMSIVTILNKIKADKDDQNLNQDLIQDHNLKDFNILINRNLEQKVIVVIILDPTLEENNNLKKLNLYLKIGKRVKIDLNLDLQVINLNQNYLNILNLNLNLIPNLSLSLINNKLKKKYNLIIKLKEGIKNLKVDLNPKVDKVILNKNPKKITIISTNKPYKSIIELLLAKRTVNLVNCVLLALANFNIKQFLKEFLF